MRDVNLFYTASNGVDIDITKIDAYIGPDGIRSTTDPRAIYIGSVGPLPRKGSITDNGSPIPVPDGSPARCVHKRRARSVERPLNVLLSVTAARYISGDPVPAAGAIDVKLTPRVKMLKKTNWGGLSDGLAAITVRHAVRHYCSVARQVLVPAAAARKAADGVKTAN